MGTTAQSKIAIHCIYLTTDSLAVWDSSGLGGARTIWTERGISLHLIPRFTRTDRPALLVREDLLKTVSVQGRSDAVLDRHVGEKWVIGPINDFKYQGSLKITGAYRYGEQGADGFITASHQPPHDRPDRT